MPPRSFPDHRLPATSPKPTEAASDTRKIPQEDIPDRTRYELLLAEATRAINDAHKRLETNTQALIMERKALEDRMTAIKDDLMRNGREQGEIQRQALKIAQITADLKNDTLDPQWYKEQERKRDMRVLVQRILSNKPISKEVRDRLGSRLVTVALAAYLNEEVMSELPIEDRLHFRKLVDTSLLKSPAEEHTSEESDSKKSPVDKRAVKEGIDKMIIARLTTAVQEGYLNIPPADKLMFNASPASASPATSSHLHEIWQRVIKNLQRQEQQTSVFKPSARSRNMTVQVKPVKREVKEISPQVIELGNELREGDSLVIKGTLITGKDITCDISLVKNITFAGNRVQFRGRLNSIEEKGGTKTGNIDEDYHFTFSFEGRGIIFATPASSHNKLATTLHFHPKSFRIVR